MKKLVLLTVIFVLVPLSISLAEPGLNNVVVNHEENLCYPEFLAGDECQTCHPPEEWTVLGIAGEVVCPKNYRIISELAGSCTGYKTNYCCSASSSGFGDCEDLLVNNQEKKCAFVKDIDLCATLPSDWKPASRGEFGAKFCPTGYGWLDNIACTDEDTIEDDRELLDKAMDKDSKTRIGKEASLLKAKVQQKVRKYSLQLFGLAYLLILLLTILLIILLYYHSPRRKQ